MQNYKVVNVADIDYLELIVRHIKQSPKNAAALADVLSDVVARLRAIIEMPESDD